jgi:hypothetical protein
MTFTNVPTALVKLPMDQVLTVYFVRNLLVSISRLLMNSVVMLSKALKEVLVCVRLKKVLRSGSTKKSQANSVQISLTNAILVSWSVMHHSNLLVLKSLPPPQELLRTLELQVVILPKLESHLTHLEAELL